MIPLFKVATAPTVLEALRPVFQSGYLGQGAVVERFEAALAQTMGLVSPPLSTNSGTSAISLALHLLDVGPGDEVISTPMTCVATNAPIVHRGATIVWADVDPLWGLIDPKDVERKVTPRTKAIVAVDWGGVRCDYSALRAHAPGIPIVQDAAHGFFPHPPHWGDYVCWSFQAIKFLTTGHGGALLAPAEQMERGRKVRWFGLDRRSSVDFRASQRIEEAGYKYHMNDIAATIGLANLPTVVNRVSLNLANAEYYDRHFQHQDRVWAPEANLSAHWWIYTLIVDDPMAFQAFMNRAGIMVSPVHSRNDLHPAFRAYWPVEPMVGLDHFAAHAMAIPVGWWLSEHDRDEIVGAVRAYGRTRPKATVYQ